MPVYIASTPDEARPHQPMGIEMATSGSKKVGRPATNNVKFTSDEAAVEIIGSIADRAASNGCDRLSTMMDVSATHANGNPLRLADLLAANDFNFFHDIYGIARHLDRETGKLMNCFSPRFSARAA